jgi:cell division septation protein DedD
MSSDVRTARQGAEDGFHEIQLSGKQLVFLFMATTIVSIVIFLCGVLVGRGARSEPPVADLADAGVAAGPGGAPPSVGEPVVDSSAPVASADPGTPTRVESSDFNYMEMLTAEQRKDEVPQPPAEPVADSGAAPAAAAPAIVPSTAASAEVPPPAKPVETPAAKAAAPVAAAAVAGKSAAAGELTIQVAALKERDEAERIVKRLQARGYDAYVAEPTAGTAMFRVRVGHFADRSQADAVAVRLAKEEKFRPWVTR